MRRAARIDATQDAIVDALLEAGYRVQTLAMVGHGVADLLVRCPDGRLALIECKSPGGTLTPAQKAWITRWPETIVAHTPEEALTALHGSDQ